MNSQKRLIAAFCFVAAVALGGFIGQGKLPAVADEPSAAATDDAAKERRAGYIAAFDRGDAKAVAQFWTPDATYVDDVGNEHKGRDDIEKLYEKQFAAHKGAKLAIHVTSRKQLTPDVMLNDGITEVTQPEGGPPTSARFTAVLVKKEGEWLLQSVRDSVAYPPSNADHFDDLEWLIGEWAGETEKGDSATAEYEWEHDQNFIVSQYAITLDGVPVSGGTQWIGWDAVEKQIRSWTFYSGGGFGGAIWTKEGNNWVLKTSAQTAAGNHVTATNIITKIDDDHMSWQLTKLTVDGKTLPDLQPLKMKRLKATQP
jgi:uncharacterized protein (TIGR02246 family)